MIQQSHSWGYTQRNATQVTPKAALFTIAELWKQPRCPTTDGSRKCVFIHNGILLSHEEE
jgi:hypothetical protein